MRQYRNEWKYIITNTYLAEVKARLEALLEVDLNADISGRYEIHSLYFDDVYNSCMRDNDQGVHKRYKYRIRYYNDNTDFIKLERKEKLLERCYKESCIIDRAQYQNIVDGNISDVFWKADTKLLKQFCIDCLTKGFTPKTIVDYERIAFVEPISNVRITLDMNISSSNETNDFLTGNYIKMPLQEKNKHVLEVKFDYILPSHIRHLITNKELVRTSFSKYYLGRHALQKKG